MLVVSDSPATASTHAPSYYVPEVDGTVRSSCSRLASEAAGTATECVLAWVSDFVIVASGAWKYRNVAAAASPAPLFRTVAVSELGPMPKGTGIVKARTPSIIGSGVSCCCWDDHDPVTVTETEIEPEQLFVVSDSSATASTHTPW